MGGGKDQKQANQQLTQQAGYQGQQQKEFDIRNKADLDASRGRADDLYKSMYEGYGSLAGTPGAGGIGASGGGGGGGGVSVPYDPRFGSVEAMYKQFMDTGGWEPDVRKAQQGRIDKLTEIGTTGGLTEEEKARARGGGYFEEFAKTGGYSDKDRANIRARATSGIPAMYAQMKAQADRGANIQGGYGPGRSVLAGRLGRQQAESLSGAARDAEIGIMEKVNQGRQWGTQGMSTSELNLQDLLSKNKLSGLGGASDIQHKMMESIMGGRQWGTGGLQGLAESDRAAQMSAAAANAAGGRADREFDLRAKLAGLEGLGSLYTSSPDEYMQNKGFALKSAGTYGTEVGNASMGLKTGNKSAWDTVGNIAGSVAGGLTGGFGGGWGGRGGGEGVGQVIRDRPGAYF